ncbi:MAG TPA: GAF domain-containing protein, partial [Terriglobales bacterium]
MRPKTQVRLTHRPVGRYVLLAAILIAAVVYHVRLSKDIRHGEKVSVPFFAPTIASPIVDLVTPPAEAAGIHRGDTIVAINNRPYTGTSVLEEAFALAQPGTPILVTLRSPGSNSERTVAVPVSRETPNPWSSALDFILQFALPILCLILGFWVAAARPRDPLAWLLLALMLAFPQIFEVHKIESWGPIARELGMTYHMLLASSWAIVMYFFGLYFPEPFPSPTTLRKIWTVLFWIGVVPMAISGIAGTLTAVIAMTDYQAAARIDHGVAPLDRYVQFVAYLVAGSFFAAISTKSYTAISTDARRRLRLLYWGTSLSMTPALIITVAARIRGKFVFEVFPNWLVGISLALIALFPLTLAYVIVVQRAMDVRVALRQGLQYALAQNGARALQFVATAVVVFTAATLAGQSSRNRPQKITVIGMGIVGVLTIRRGAEGLRSWIDRRFFREVYNAEQVLTELSEQVRTMVESRPLLETVVNRIAETLHVRNIAVLLAGGNAFRPAYAFGYSSVPETVFPMSTATVKRLEDKREPSRVYLEDPDSWINTEPQANDKERAQLAELHAELLLPLSVRDKLLGFISLGPKRSEEPYSGSDVRLLKSVAVQTGLALENANLMRAIAEEIAHRERLNREVEIAREVQERLFPQKLPHIQGLDYAGHCRPALGVGGDYYDFLALPQGHLGVAIG